MKTLDAIGGRGGKATTEVTVAHDAAADPALRRCRYCGLRVGTHDRHGRDNCIVEINARDEMARATEAHLRVAGYTLSVSEHDAIDLASGYVPVTVRARVLELLDLATDDRRRASRPVHVKAPRQGKDRRR